MSRDHDSTDPDSPAVNVPDGVVRGEARPPDEHTMRVRARQKPAQESHLKVHDQSTPDPDPDPPAARSSSEMADSSRRQRRRERDRRAERRAMQTVVLVFVGLGGGAFALVNYLVVDDPVVPPPPTDPNQIVPPPPPRGVISAQVDDTPDIPAFQHLRDTGLTIAAEGIPQVDALEAGSSVAALAALETCRFSYAVWEFSPNARFRFMTTCGALEGQVMFGAYEIDGAVIRMSPLVSDTDAVTSEFHVEKPSKMVSRVSRVRDGPQVLEIHQKVTAMRPGMDGDAWRNAYLDRNTIHLPSEKSKAPPPSQAPPPPAKKDGDPLLDLLKQG